MTALSLKPTSSRPLPVELADAYRLEISHTLDARKRGELGQYLTPLPVAQFMASLFETSPDEVILFDPGAGAGTLTAAFLQEMARRNSAPRNIRAHCYEIDPSMVGYLRSTLTASAAYGESVGVHFTGNIVSTDFIQWGAEKLKTRGSFFEESTPQFTHCIMNPPYKKIRSDSAHRAWLREIGIETSNLYSGFLAIAIQLLAPGGELVAITPRSFCNGPYFRQFRMFLLENMAIRHLHVFETRNKAFEDDDVLQENIIIHAVKGAGQGKVTITASSGIDFDDRVQREASFDQVVKPGDADSILHIAASELDQMVVDRISVFKKSLAEIGVDVSTGPVVEFRLQNDIIMDAEKGACPLIYPAHFDHGFVKWPNLDGKKPNAILETKHSSRWLMKNDWYTLIKRFSSKEEPRRLVAAVHIPRRIPGEKIGFENHVNVFHRKRAGLEPAVAKGLAVYLNSTLLDLYFRQFSGHTQVNATDLRALRYPTLATLRHLGASVTKIFPDQEQIDHLLDEVIDKMTDSGTRNPLPIQRRVREALSILESLGLPKGQRNERSALTLLALLDLKPEDSWQIAAAPLMGITPIMDFIREHYGKSYAPNTRETIRRQTVHQFVEAGMVIPNPDDPGRPINSPHWHYQISPETLALLRTYGSDDWEMSLNDYLASKTTLARRYAHERTMQKIPLRIGEGETLMLSPGKHSELIRAIIEEFGPRYAPGARALYVGDTGAKMALFDEKAFDPLGLSFDSRGKFPDVVLHLPARNWLLLVEAVTSHGPVDAKRHAELASLFDHGTADVIYVTAFPDRRTLAKYLGEISWETEVWVADSPDHLIHFDGEKFLGPYRDQSSQ